MLEHSPEMEFLDDAVSVLAENLASHVGREAAGNRSSAIRDECSPGQKLDFQEIGDHLYDGVYIADGSGLTLYVNKSYERITGLKASEVVGRYVQDLLAAGVYSNAVTPEVLRLKKRVDSVGRSSRNGSRMLITGNPIFDQDGKIKLVAVIEREITDLDTMLIELEATKDKIRSVEVVEMRNRREIEHLRKERRSAKLIGESRQILEILALVRRVADFDVTVLVQGETGVGKEIVATEIHESSLRKDKPFIRVNCAAIPSNLLETELFGYEKGAYTGAASAGKIGLFELADKGTLLLDEIGDMPLELQGKLLRVLQQKELTRVGGTRAIPLDVRVITATNCDLQALTQSGKFRADLFFRLNVFPISIPPLRSRPDDILLLAEHFFNYYNMKYSKKVRIAADALALFASYPWPGNVRELQNVVERLILISDQSSVLDGDSLLPMLRLEQPSPDAAPASAEKGLKEIVNEFERRIVEQALRQHGSTRKAAAALGIDQSTIVKKAKRLQIRT
ncbi:MAG: norR 15 [Proteobacteria bacterium]|nr:norR 15 [Pseudomonadota bacterium]